VQNDRSPSRAPPTTLSASPSPQQPSPSAMTSGFAAASMGARLEQWEGHRCGVGGRYRPPLSQRGYRFSMGPPANCWSRSQGHLWEVLAQAKVGRPSQVLRRMRDAGVLGEENQTPETGKWSAGHISAQHDWFERPPPGSECRCPVLETCRQFPVAAGGFGPHTIIGIIGQESRLSGASFGHTVSQLPICCFPNCVHDSPTHGLHHAAVFGQK
jgi:hypothetical protein